MAGMTDAPVRPVVSTSERLKAYTDAVVAIAQTLLILPLLESVSEAKAHHLTTGQWLTENGDSVLYLIMSFVLIGTFWLAHNRVFEHIEYPSETIRGLNFVWMLGIVLFPVISAVLGLEPADATQKVLYIGCMLMCSLALNGIVLLSGRHPSVRGELPPLGAKNVAASLSSTLLYLLALLLALLIPGGKGYFALFVMGLMPVMIRLLSPLVRRLNLAA